jgi:hypothetical protein
LDPFADLRVGERDEVVVMQLDAPALVRGVLREHGLAHRVAHRELLSGIGAHLAAEHADRIGSLLERAIVPALDRGEAEADGLAGGGMLPRALGQSTKRGLQLALGRRCGQQLPDDGEAQICGSPLFHVGSLRSSFPAIR